MKKFSKPLTIGLVSLLTVALALVSLTLTGCRRSSTSSAAKVLTVAVIEPLTGPDARTGEEMKDAVDMAFSEVGYKIGDYTVKLEWLDDQSDPQVASTAYEQAVEKDKFDCSMGGWNSSVAVALMEEAAKYQIPYFFHFGSTDVVNQKYASDPKYHYWIGKGWASAEKLEVAYAQAINEAVANGTYKPRNKKIAIWAEDTDWGRSFASAISQSFQSTGWDVVSEQYVAVGETDMYPVLTKIKNEDASLVLETCTSPDTQAAAIKQAKEVNLNALVGADGLGWIGDWYKMSGSASDGTLDCEPLFVGAAANKFVTDFTAKYNIVPSAAAAGQVYDWTRYFIQIANNTLKTEGSLNSQTLYQYATQYVMTGQDTFNNGIIMKQLKFDAASAPDPVVGNGEYIFPVIQYFGGKPVVIWPDYQKNANLKS